MDSGWYGTVVVETEGTNESLADLQERCGPGAFPPRAGEHGRRENEARLVFRILRERRYGFLFLPISRVDCVLSRPGEIWIRTVSSKERIS